MSEMSEETTKKRRTRRQFTAEYKSQAVRLVLSEGQQISAVAKNLGLYESTLYQWVAQARADAGEGKAGIATSSQLQELAALRKENRILKMERDILKKAAAFFAKENG